MDTKWTDQTAFDAAYVHCMKQKVRAVSDDGDCLYRGPNGTKCAVGCLIPDDLYDPSMEHEDGYEVMEIIGWGHLNHSLIDRVQEAHDVYLDPDDLSKFHNEMKGISERYALEWNHD